MTILLTEEEEQRVLQENGGFLVNMMGGDLEMEVAVRVLRKFHGDVHRAAEAILGGDRAEDDFWTPTENSTHRVLPASNSVIDLTGGSEDHDGYRSGRPLTREPSTPVRTRADPPSNRTIKFAPTDRAPSDNWAVVPTTGNNAEVEMGSEDPNIKAAIEASLHDYAPVEEEDEPVERTLRDGDTPVSIRVDQPGLIYAALVLQVLYYIPQFRRRLAQLPIVHEPNKPRNVHQKLLWELAELYANMDLSRLAVIFDNEIIPALLPSPWDGTTVGVGENTTKILTQIARIFDQQMEILQPSTRVNSFHFIHGSIELTGNGEEPRMVRNPDPGLSILVHVGGWNPALNELYSRLVSSLWRVNEDGFYSEVIFEAPQTLVFSLATDNTPTPYGSKPSPPEPFKYPKTFYLDRFLSRNVALIRQKQIQEGKIFVEIQALQAQKKALTSNGGRESLSDLKASLHYFENIAGSKDNPDRQATINQTSAKLKAIIAAIQDRVADLDRRIVDLQTENSTLYDCAELQVHPYDLRAVMVYTGMPGSGRKQIYSYVQDDMTGTWWKNLDSIVTQVTEEMVINDTTGLHLAAGPYALFYSARMTKEEAETPAMWPKHFVSMIHSHNEELLQLDSDLSIIQGETGHARAPSLGQVQMQPMGQQVQVQGQGQLQIPPPPLLAPAIQRPAAGR